MEFQGDPRSAVVQDVTVVLASQVVYGSLCHPERLDRLVLQGLAGTLVVSALVSHSVPFARFGAVRWNKGAASLVTSAPAVIEM